MYPHRYLPLGHTLPLGCPNTTTGTVPGAKGDLAKPRRDLEQLWQPTGARGRLLRQRGGLAHSEAGIWQSSAVMGPI